MGAGGAGRRGVPGSRLAVEAKAAEAMAAVARLMEVVMVAKGAVVPVATRQTLSKGGGRGIAPSIGWRPRRPTAP